MKLNADRIIGRFRFIILNEARVLTLATMATTIMNNISCGSSVRLGWCDRESNSKISPVATHNTDTLSQQRQMVALMMTIRAHQRKRGWGRLCACGLNLLGRNMSLSVRVCVCARARLAWSHMGEVSRFISWMKAWQTTSQGTCCYLSAPLFLSHQPLSFYPYLFYPWSPQTFAINSPARTFIHFSFPHLSIWAFSPSAPLCPLLCRFPPPSKSSFHFRSATIHFSPSTPLPIPTSAVAESALPFRSPLQTHKCTASDFHALV